MSMITTITQLEAAPEMRGRVMSLITVTMQGFSPLGSLVIGALAGIISTEHAVALSAGLCGVMALLAIAVAPVVRDYESAPPEPAPAPLAPPLARPAPALKQRLD
jgi:hypothetical protein